MAKSKEFEPQGPRQSYRHTGALEPTKGSPDGHVLVDGHDGHDHAGHEAQNKSGYSHSHTISEEQVKAGPLEKMAHGGSAHTLHHRGGRVDKPKHRNKNW